MILSSDRPAFFLYFILKIFGSIVMLFINLDFRMPSSQVNKDCKILLKNSEVISFLIVMLITGMLLKETENYPFKDKADDSSTVQLNFTIHLIYTFL